MLEGAKKGEDFVKKLTEMIKGLENATLPESFLVNRRTIVESSIRSIGRKRKKRVAISAVSKELHISIASDTTEKITPIIYKVTIKFHR